MEQRAAVNSRKGLLGAGDGLPGHRLEVLPAAEREPDQVQATVPQGQWVVEEEEDREVDGGRDAEGRHGREGKELPVAARLHNVLKYLYK